MSSSEGKARVSVSALNHGGKASVLLLKTNIQYKALIKRVAQKLKYKQGKRLFVKATGVEVSAENLESLLVTGVEFVMTKVTAEYICENPVDARDPSLPPLQTRVIAQASYVDMNAVSQLEKTAARFPGITIGVGMPDLHVGRPNPIGAVFAGKQVLPTLVGGDIGCGMALFDCGFAADKVTDRKKTRWAKALSVLDDPWETAVDCPEGGIDGYLADLVEDLQSPHFTDSKVHVGKFNASMGTVGAGNHFAELQGVEQIMDEEEFKKLNLHAEQLYLLIHSGSRGLGKAILDAIGKERALENDSPALETYLHMHNTALQWATKNRLAIATRFLSAMQASSNVAATPAAAAVEKLRRIDIYHNFVCKKTFESKKKTDDEQGDESNNNSSSSSSSSSSSTTTDNDLWLHRKGAAPADVGPVVIPGSRGTLSYIVLPLANGKASSAYSLAHGAGRKWARSKALAKGQTRYPNSKVLKTTRYNSTVVCGDKNLLYEEAPEAYKDIDVVIQDLVDLGLIKVIASMRPVLTYKVSDHHA